MGGALAEGVDLPGDQLIGAVIVGPGLPAPSFERDQMRRYFDGRGRDGFAYAMLYPGMQRVIQSAGRVIRTMEDRGVIALLDERFARPPYAGCLPADWYEQGAGELVADFWQNRGR
jgi:DNA excision repair protein ERCC-2